MKFWGIIVLVVLGGFVIFSGIRRRFSSSSSSSSSPASVVSSDTPSAVPVSSSPPSPFVRCESFWARDDVVVGAFGDGFLFQGPPDGSDGSAVLYRRDRGTKI